MEGKRLQKEPSAEDDALPDHPKAGGCHVGLATKFGLPLTLSPAFGESERDQRVRSLREKF